MGNRSVPVSAAVVLDPIGEPVQALRAVLTPLLTGNTGAVSTAALDLGGARVVLFTLGADAWIRFGASDVDVAAAVAPSWFMRAGTYVLPVPLTNEQTNQHATHVRLIQATSAGVYQFLGVS